MRGRSQQSFTTLPLPLSTAVPITDTAHTATTMFPNPFQTELASRHNHHWRYIIIKLCSVLVNLFPICEFNPLLCRHVLPIFATTVDYLQCKKYKQVFRQVLKPSNVFVNYIDSSLCIIFSFTLTKFHKMHSILLNSLCCCCLFLSEILKQVTDQPEARDQGQHLKTDWFSLC